MEMEKFIRIFFLTLIFTFVHCFGQKKTALLKDSVTKQTTNAEGQSKIIKNHFLQWPDDYFSIQCGLQDKRGTIWFGSSADGIYSYNGKSFTNFTRNNGLCHNDILCMLEDNTGTIWFGTRGGLCCYKPSVNETSNKTFTSFLFSESNRYTANNFVWSIMQDRAGKIWLGTNEGVYVSDPVTASGKNEPVFKLFLGNDSISNKDHLKLKVVQKIIEDKNGAIWFTSGDFKGEGICRYNGKSLVSFKPDSITSFRTALEQKNGNLLFLTSNHRIYQYDGQNFSDFKKSIGLKNEPVTAMLEDKAGKIWFGLDNSTDSVKAETGYIRCYDGSSLKVFTTQNGIIRNAVSCIIGDREGNVWFGTSSTGLYRYDGKIMTDYTDK